MKNKMSKSGCASATSMKCSSDRPVNQRSAGGTETEPPFAGSTATTRGRDMRWKTEGDEQSNRRAAWLLGLGAVSQPGWPRNGNRSRYLWTQLLRPPFSLTPSRRGPVSKAPLLLGHRNCVLRAARSCTRPATGLCVSLDTSRDGCRL